MSDLSAVIIERLRQAAAVECGGEAVTFGIERGGLGAKYVARYGQRSHAIFTGVRGRAFDAMVRDVDNYYECLLAAISPA